MFSQRNNPYCELISNCESKIQKNINICNLYKKRLFLRKIIVLIPPFEAQ